MFAKKPAVKNLRSTPYNFSGDSSFEMPTGMDTTDIPGFFDTTDASDQKPAQNRRLQSLKFLNYNMNSNINFWRKKFNANTNAHSSFGDDQEMMDIEKGLGCCKIVIGVSIFIILVTFVAMAIVLMLKVDSVAERLGSKCQMTNCETGHVLGTAPPAVPVAEKEVGNKKPKKAQRQRDSVRGNHKHKQDAFIDMTDEKLNQLLRQLSVAYQQKESGLRRFKDHKVAPER